MSGRLTMWGANQLLRSYFTKAATPPECFYVALVKDVAPTPYMSGAELTEPDCPEYARVRIDNNLLCWANDSQPQEIYNNEQIAFPYAASDWGIIRYWALTNAYQQGYCLVSGELDDPVQIQTGDRAIMAVGDLSVTLGPFFLEET